MNWKKPGWAIAAFVVCTHAGAVDFSFRPNAAEMARLPPYCQAKFTLPQGSPEWNAWRDRIGQNFIDLHHYCSGLNFVNRYWSARNPKDRGFYLQNALNNFNYMVRAAKPGFALGAEVYSDRGALLKLMGKPGEAAKDFNQALSINPELVRPYLQLADLQVEGKETRHALETVTKGLRHVPDSKALQRRYLELGGKKPFPDPVASKAAAESALGQMGASASPEAAAEPVEAAAVEAKPESGGQKGASPAIGTPTNPYCRFCPPE